MGALGAVFRTRPRAEAPVPYVPRAGGGLSSVLSSVRAGRGKAISSYVARGTIFAIVSRLANAVSQVEWHMHKPGPPSAECPIPGCDARGVRLLEGHPAAQQWDRPNPFMHRQVFVETFSQHIELAGESEWVIVPAFGKVPLEIWPVRPDRMEPVPHPEKFMTGWRYRGPGGEEVPLELERVIQLKMPDPDNIYRGIGPISSIFPDVDAAVEGARWSRNFFLNSAQPGGIIEMPEPLNDDDFDELRQRWEEQHKGVNNAHRVAILERGKWVDRKYSMRDMEFTAGRELSREVIREAWGYPKPMLGATDDVNRANAEAGEYVFTRWLVDNRCARIRGALNEHLLPLYGPSSRGLGFAYVCPVPADREADDRERTSKAMAYKTLVDARVDPVDAATTVGYAAPMRTIAAPPPPAPGPAKAASPATFAWFPEEAPGPVVAADPPPALSRVQQNWLAALDALESTWTNDVSPDQLDAIAAQVRAAVDDGEPARLGQLSVATVESTTVILDGMVDLAAVAAERVVEEADAAGVKTSRGHVSREELRPIAAGAAGLLGTSIALAAGREALRLYVAGQTSGAELADRVIAFLRGEDVSAGPAGWFAGLRTALAGLLGRAQNAGRIATLRVAPEARYYASEKLDTNTCKNCKSIDGQRLPTLDAALLAYGGNGGYLFCLGRERCRGTMIAVWGENDE